MKRWVCVILLMTFLTGCSNTDDCLVRGMALRTRMLGEGCSFDASITADYGDQTYSFVLNCTADPEGNVSFAVMEPSSIQGITGRIGTSGGQLTFDEVAVSFPLLADGELSPVSSVWILVSTLRGGYLRACGLDQGMLRITIDDSYEADALQVDIWLNEQDLPRYAEILWQGRRIVSLEVSNFVFV